MRKFILLFLFSVSILLTKAQQDAMVSQYMFNGLFLNPAYAGSHDYFSSTLLYRQQWVNFAGAPSTAIVAVDGPLLNKKMGVGLIASNDKIGVTNQTDVYANYSYFLKMGKGKLSFGIKAGASQYKASVKDLTVWDQNDQVFTGTIRTAWIPKFGFGSYYYTDKFYAGFSIPALLAYGDVKSLNIDVSKHYYLTSGYVFTVDEKFKIKPSFLLKYQSAAPVQIDLNLTVMFIDQFALGVSYRTGDAFVMMAEYQANKRFRIGYAYDITTTAIKSYSSGTHEIMVGFDFGKNIIKTKTPRFF